MSGLSITQIPVMENQLIFDEIEKHQKNNYSFSALCERTFPIENCAIPATNHFSYFCSCPFLSSFSITFHLSHPVWFKIGFILFPSHS